MSDRTCSTSTVRLHRGLGLVEGSAPLGGDGGLAAVVDGGLGGLREVPRRDRVVVGHVPDQLGVGDQPLGQGPADQRMPAGPASGRQVGVHRSRG